MSSMNERNQAFCFALLIMAAVCVVVIVPYMKMGVSMAATFFLIVAVCPFRPACPGDLHTNGTESAAVSYCGKIITSVFILLSVECMIAHGLPQEQCLRLLMWDFG